jgi:hypothetical protein
MAKFRFLTAFKHGARGGNGVQAELNSSRVYHLCLDTDTGRQEGLLLMGAVPNICYTVLELVCLELFGEEHEQRESNHCTCRR